VVDEVLLAGGADKEAKVQDAGWLYRCTARDLASQQSARASGWRRPIHVDFRTTTTLPCLNLNLNRAAKRNQGNLCKAPKIVRLFGKLQLHCITHTPASSTKAPPRLLPQLQLRMATVQRDLLEAKQHTRVLS
jgi:hypothetical protein